MQQELARDEAVPGLLSDAEAETIGGLLRAAANPNRLRILSLLLEGEQPVGGIEQILGIRQPTLSQQLGALREARLVTTRRAHKVVFYALTDMRAAALLVALHDIFRAEAARPRALPRRSGRRPAEAAVFATVGGPA